MRERLSRRDGCVADKSVTSFRRCRRITGCWCIASPRSLVWSTTSTSQARPSLSTAAAPHECTSGSPSVTVSESVCRLLPTRVVPDKGPLNGCVCVCVCTYSIPSFTVSESVCRLLRLLVSDNVSFGTATASHCLFLQ